MVFSFSVLYFIVEIIKHQDTRGHYGICKNIFFKPLIFKCSSLLQLSFSVSQTVVAGTQVIKNQCSKTDLVKTRSGRYSLAPLLHGQSYVFEPGSDVVKVEYRSDAGKRAAESEARQVVKMMNKVSFSCEMLQVNIFSS